MTKPPNGFLVVSLDFELAWGAENDRVEGFRQVYLGARRAIPAILSVFGEYGIHATWATVGMLFFETKDELMSSLPANKPAYSRPGISACDRLGRVGADEQEDPLHFAPSLIRQIASSPGQEIATHTFSHYYCLEPGQHVAAFEDDLRAAVAVAKLRGVALSSIAFPRNHVREDYLPVCRRYGLIAYRGDPERGTKRSSGDSVRVLLRRGLRRAGSPVRALIRPGLRLANAYFPVSGWEAFTPAAAGPSGMVCIPASWFLRPWSRTLRFLEAQRVRRILGGMTYAAENGLGYHLWWHPHNFGRNLNENLTSLRRILDHYSLMRESHGMKSVGMADLARSMPQGGDREL